MEEDRGEPLTKTNQKISDCVETIYFFSEKSSQMESCTMEISDGEEGLFRAWGNLSGIPSCVVLNYFSVESVPEISPYPYITIGISKEIQPYVREGQTILWETLSQTVKDKYGKNGKATVSITISDTTFGEIPVYEERADNLSMDCLITVEADPIETIYYFSEKTEQIETVVQEIPGGGEAIFEKWRELSGLPNDIILNRYDIITGKESEIMIENSKVSQYTAIEPVIEIELSGSSMDNSRLFQESLLETLAKTAEENFIKNHGKKDKNKMGVKIFIEGDEIYVKENDK